MKGATQGELRGQLVEIEVEGREDTAQVPKGMEGSHQRLKEKEVVCRNFKQ